MRRRLLVVALAVVVGANAWAVIHAVRNRAGQPDAELELTERELQFVPRGSDDSSLTLMLQWHNRADEYRPPLRPGAALDFFDRDKLEQAGFDVGVAADAPGAERFYQAQRSRDVFVALEYDGPAFAAWLRDREVAIGDESKYAPQIAAADRLRIERETTSRLVVVDVDRDAARLRSRWPDRATVLILPGRARAVVDVGPPRRLRGAVTGLSIQNITVGNEFRGVLTARRGHNGWSTNADGSVTITPPGFAATIRVGSSYEPWVTAMRTLP